MEKPTSSVFTMKWLHDVAHLELSSVPAGSIQVAISITELSPVCIGICTVLGCLSLKLRSLINDQGWDWGDVLWLSPELSSYSLLLDLNNNVFAVI